MLERRVLGQLGIKVTELCLGVLPMGPLQADKPRGHCVQLIRMALDLGINFIDTAEVYGTQEYVGEALHGYQGQVVVATKSNAATYDDMRASVERSLQELGVNCIDIYHLHAARVTPEVFREREGALECLKEFKARGQIRAIGVSTHVVGVVEAAARCDDIDVIFPIINTAGIGIVGGTREDMVRAIETAARAGKGLYAMKALGGGHLADDPVEAFGFVRGIPGISAVAVGVVSEKELDVDYRIFTGQPVAGSETGRARKRLLVMSFCQACGKCVEVCPNGALSLGEDRAVVDPAKCILCGYCNPVCPQFAIRLI